MIHVENLADGRSNIVLQGLCRYKILEEDLARTPYRQAHITLAAEADSTALTSSFRADLLAILQDLLSPRQKCRTGRRFASDVSDEILINTLSAMVDFTPLEKQLLLEADTEFQRARRLSDLLQFKRYERNDRKGKGVMGQQTVAIEYPDCARSSTEPPPSIIFPSRSITANLRALRPQWAGKSTTLRMLITLLRPTGGRATHYGL